MAVVGAIGIVPFMIPAAVVAFPLVTNVCGASAACTSTASSTDATRRSTTDGSTPKTPVTFIEGVGSDVCVSVSGLSVRARAVCSLVSSEWTKLLDFFLFGLSCCDSPTNAQPGLLASRQRDHRLVIHTTRAYVHKHVIADHWYHTHILARRESRLHRCLSSMPSC